MFAVIYQGYIKPGRESDYRSAWNVVARYFVKRRGAIGSCLHQVSDGSWLAYSRWPSKEMRDASWPQDDCAPSETLPQEIHQAILTVKDCIDQNRPFTETCMEVIDDLLC